jgi:hypothetical protein
MRSKQKYSFTIFVVVVCLALAVPARATVTKRLYIDGVLTGSNAVPGQLAYTYDRITIACEGNQWYMYNSLQGGLDEFAIYDGVLSNTDVLDHYNAAQVDEPNYVAEVCSDNPQIYLRLNDAIKANGAPAVRDSCSAVNRDGTYINTVIPAPGIFAPNDLCAVFAGDLPDANLMGCIDIWDGDRVLAFDEVSIEVWVNSTHLYDNYPRLFQHNGGWLNENAYGATCIDGNGPNNPGGEYAGVIGAMDTSYFATGNINDGTWHHVVVTYEYTYELNGYDTEVMKDNPLIWFRFEEEIGRDVNVVNHGSRYVEAKYVGHNPHFAPGKVGKGVYLHDTGDEAIIIFSPAYTGGANYSHLYALTPGDMSVEVWFRARPFYEYNEDGELNWARLYSNNGTYNNKDSARTYLTASGYLTGAGSKGTYAQTYLYTEHPGFNPSAPEPSLTGPADGDWHHVVVTYNVDDIDPNNSPPVVIQFYLDGALLGSRLIDLDAMINTTGIMGPEFREFVIGADGSSDGERWNCFLGTLDEFALYDHVLPQDRIIIHYQEGMAAQPWVPENCEDIYTFGWNISADKNGDCYVNFKDIIDMSKDWWRCIEPIDESCEKPWSH